MSEVNITVRLEEIEMEPAEINIADVTAIRWTAADDVLFTVSGLDSNVFDATESSKDTDEFISTVTPDDKNDEEAYNFDVDTKPRNSLQKNFRHFFYRYRFHTSRYHRRPG